MKINEKCSKLLALSAAMIASLILGSSARADVYWVGWDSTDWADTNNWGGPGGFPTNAGAGNAIINPGPNPCVVSNAGNYTVDGVYVSIDAGLSIMPGGQLTVPTTFVTGVWGNSLPVDITGGELNIGGYLNIGAGGFAGNVNISGGTVTAGNVAINSTGGAKMDILTNGTFITILGGNAQFYVANNNITANGNAVGWSVNMDTNSIPGQVVLTAVYVPPSPSTNYVFDNGGGDNLWTNLANWNPDGQPGQYDSATVAGALSVILNSGTEGLVGKLLVGATNGEGAVNFNAGCSVSFRDTNVSLIVGGITNSGVYPSYCIFNGGSVITVGDVVLGGSGGRVDARHYGGNCTVGGTLRLGSYLYAPGASATNASLRLIGSSGGFGGIGAIEIGDAATLAYEFNGGSAIKPLSAAGAVTISSGAVLVVDGTGYSGLTSELTLLQGSSLTGTFTTAILTNFPSGTVPSLIYTANRLRLSVVGSHSTLGLAIQNLGGGQVQVSWNSGILESKTNILGTWQVIPCAVSPWVEAASVAQKYYRAKLLGNVYEYDNDSNNNLWTTAANWNPDGTPGQFDDTVVENGRGVFLTAPAGDVRSIIVGKTTGNGALNVLAGGSISLKDPCISVIVGGASASPFVNYYRHSGDLDTVGDFVMGFRGGRVDGQFAAGTLAIGGTLRLGSFMSPGYSFFELLGGGGTITAGGLEVGSAGELIYNFNSGNTLKTLVVSGNVSLLSGSTLTLKGTGFPNGTGTYDYTLIQGGSRTGTFTTVNVSGFPVAGTTATVGYAGGNVTLQVVVP